MKSWQPIPNDANFHHCRILHSNSQGRPIVYRSIQSAAKVANKLNQAVRRGALKLIEEAHSARRAIDRIGGVADNRPENLQIATLKENHR